MSPRALDTPEGRRSTWRALVRRLAAVLRAGQLHPAETPALAAATEDLGELLRAIAGRVGAVRVTTEDEVRVNGEPILGGARRTEPDLLTPLLRRRRFTGIDFDRGPGTAELKAFLGIWRAWRPGSGSFNEALRRAGVRSFRVLGPDEGPGRGPEPTSHDHHEVLDGYCALLAVADRLTDPSAPGDDTDRKADAAVHRMAAIVVASPDAALSMATHRDPARYEAVHATNTSVLSMLLARHVGLGPESIVDVGRGGLYCDRALALRSGDVRHARGKLGRDLAKRVRVHPIDGFLLSLRGDGLDEADRARAIVGYEHHIGVDGAGYPPQLGGRVPHLFSRIVAIADGYDALCHDRGDRPGLPRPLALESLAKGAGKRYDEALLHRFFEFTGRFPPGSVVRLGSGNIALVARPSDDVRFFDRPSVYVVRDPAASPLPAPRSLDLARPPDGKPRWVAKVLHERLYPERLIPLLLGT